MADNPAFIWDRKTVGRPPKRAAGAQKPSAAVLSPPQAVGFGDRITVREAEARFGLTAAKLRGLAKSGEINGIMGAGPTGGRVWLLTPESIARFLSNASTAPATATVPSSAGVGAVVSKTGPTADGSAMLVPRDAWDRLMDQLGNLHDAGVQLAEARERAVKAETEATFLRERLAEMRGERDELKDKVNVVPKASGTSAPTPLIDRMRDAFQRLVGK